VWTRLLAVGEAHGLQPAGLGARDTLRTEMGFPLYGHELSEDVSPLEAGLGPFVAFDKPEFVGREVWLAQKASGVTRRRVAFRMAEKGALPRPHCGIWSTEPDGRRVGEVTSGTQSPCLGVGIGMGYVPPPWAAPGTPIGIEIRGRRHPAVVHARPIYQRKAAVAG
jgi:aminomethyltransferase